MSSAVFAPALMQLIALRTRAKLRRMLQTCLVPRRAVLTLLVVLLGMLWLASAGVNLMFRQAYDPAVFRQGISLSLTVYFLWHLIHLAWKRPEDSLEWTPAEQFFLTSSPFSARQVMAYRLAVIFSATLFKASIVTLLLLPDLPYKLLGFSGFLSGLIFLEFLRVNLETVAQGVPLRVWKMYRAVVCIGLLSLATFLLYRVFGTAGDGATDLRDLRDLVTAFVGEFTALRESAVGRVIEWPFTLFASVITAQSLSLELGARILGCLTLIVAAGRLAIVANLFFRGQKFRREQEQFLVQTDRAELSLSEKSAPLQLPSIPRCGGIGPIAWRQLLGVRAYVGSVVMSLVIPALLALFPLAVPNNPIASFMSVVSGALFFSFVLLPAALKFDFRRDYDRLSALKMLPVSTRSIVWGQLLTPVSIMFLFLVTVLGMAALIRPVPFDWFIGTLSMLLPVVIFFVALDNLIFLWFPHRLNEEGFEVFLRSILTFTAKVILLGLMLGTILSWDAVVLRLVDRIAIPQRLTFVCGLNVMAWGLALSFVALVTRAFRRFDPSVERSA